ncbi:hypothetical protein A2356_02135 [Candidatus Nomurabacteria bacterium RIFOXYB1_FULL_39_16]|uniref:Capsule polysaccharide biosynthesis protein n=2 Tax=Patescibacteria group TaxID=1783273 RepID=A0A1F6YTT8_9BACT|nr:MAG: hypothetical protein A2356_02135 [Candidatus Nomurabacteria bacterium RIFOXYB1_FULL_39_16]OGJ13875.1 MAG: hypothetical protein A2585_01680 [Candidatus Nomurabacteria bacterium RIFOXYD1_FULL_39_12]
MKIVSYASHTSTWHFAFAEAALALALKKQGHEILYISGGNNYGLKSNLMQEQIIKNEFGFDGYTIDQAITDKDWGKIQSILDSTTKENYEKLTILGIPIAKIALYEFLLNRKKTEIKFSDYDWKECQTHIKYTIISFYACISILKKEKPDVVLLYNALYSVNRVWELVCKHYHIKVYFIHHGLNLKEMDKRLIVAKGNQIEFYNYLIKIWSHVKNLPVPVENLKIVTEHVKELFKATHYLVYSAPKSESNLQIRKLLKIKDNQKIITATMSSYDEIYTAEYVGARKIPKDVIFNDQIDWIKNIVNYVKTREDLFLIIRVHPREFPNKRESVQSDHALKLKKIFWKLPDNVCINWPTDNISIYDLCQVTNVFLNAWSTVGVEMGLLGLPVVLYSKDLILYPADLNYLAKNKNDYFRKIETALKNGWNYNRVKYAYRWLSLLHSSCTYPFRVLDTQPNNAFSIPHYQKVSLNEKIQRLLPVQVKQILSQILVKVPFTDVGKNQIQDCIRQKITNIDIAKVEKMLLKSSNTLVNIKDLRQQAPRVAVENLQIRRELKVIYEALFPGKNNLRNIKKTGNNLKYNLYRITRNL